MNALERLATTAATQGNPIDALRHFLRTRKQEAARNLDQMRFVGYVIELGYDTAKIITNDPYKVAVGGIPRGSFLIMTPAKEDKALHISPCYGSMAYLQRLSLARCNKLILSCRKNPCLS